MVNIFRFARVAALMVLGILVLSGFRLSQEVQWDISENDPTVWLKVDSDIVENGFKTTKFKDGNDILEGVSDPSEQTRLIVGQIVDDYNSIATSYARVAIYPTDDFPDLEQDGLDSPFDEDVAKQRTIHVKYGSSAALGAAGAAKYQTDGDHITRCDIVLSKNSLVDASSFKRTLTHEIGHCFGIMHNHNDRNSIMSYSAKSGLNSLGIDDKMALTFLYPRDNKYNQETPTFGMSCQRN
jgi:hypothetical protein